MKKKVLSLVMGNGELTKVSMSLQIERWEKEFGLKVPLTTLNRWKAEYRKKYEERSEREKVKAMKSLFWNSFDLMENSPILGKHTAQAFGRRFWDENWTTTLVRWKKKYHIPSQTENLQPQWDATKKLVLELVTPNGLLFGLSGSEQMRRLQRDYGIKIGRTTFERWKNAYFKQSEEKSS